MHFLKQNRVVMDKQQLEDLIKQTMLVEDSNPNIIINKSHFMQMFWQPICLIGLQNALTLSRDQQKKGTGLLSKEDPLYC